MNSKNSKNNIKEEINRHVNAAMGNDLEISENLEQKLAFHLINYTGKNLFITGKAGTGKTTFLKYIKNNCKKNIIVCAPTGIAAINAGGNTIHSLFGFPLVSYIPKNEYVDRNLGITPSELVKHFKYNKEKRKLFLELDLLIIDEVSMLRSDTLDAIHLAFQFVRKNNKPFGGVQLLMIGDMFQLPPVIREEQKKLLSHYYKSPYFFDSHILTDNIPVCIEFKKVYRQESGAFLDLLNAIRFQDFATIDFDLLNSRFQPDFLPEQINSTSDSNSPSYKANYTTNYITNYITLTTHNYQAEQINKRAIEKIDAPFHYFDAKIEGSFKDNLYPTEIQLSLKKGCQVMFIRNDSSGSKRYFNGKLAIIENIKDDKIWVRFEDNRILQLEREIWRNIRYTIDENGKIKEENIGDFAQFPIRLAWAITIHKSQGLTFDRVIIDAGKSFTSGQVYVALSRCRTLEGIILRSKISSKNIIIDNVINSFQNKMWNVEELEILLDTEKYHYALEFLLENLSLHFIHSELKELRLFLIKRNIPDKENILNLYAQIDEKLEYLINISKKFENNLRFRFNEEKEISVKWEAIESRSRDALRYFTQELYYSIWQPVHNHYLEYKNKAKIRAYLKEITEFKNTLQHKTQYLTSFCLLNKLLITAEESEKFVFEELENAKGIRAENNNSNNNNNNNDNKDSDNKDKNTEMLTYYLLKEGKTLEETAKERNLTLSTISNHVSKLIAKGKLFVMDYVSSDAYTDIKEIIENKEIKELKTIKKLLEDKYTYDEIKWVRSDLLKN